MKKLKKQAKTKEKKRKGGKVFLVILLILIIIGAIFGYKVYKNGGWNLKGLSATMLGHDENTVNNLPKMYCLILGKSQNLTDTIMLAS